MEDPLEARIEEVRAFNRFWTAQAGVLGASHLDTPYSLTEARVLFELAQTESTLVSALRQTLGLDAGYLSRILAQFKEDKLVAISASDSDARQKVARLSAKGRRAFELVNGRAAVQVRTMLSRLGSEEQGTLLGAMGAIRGVLEEPASAPRAYVLRPPRPGDLGWIVQRHGVLYAEEYGWDSSFEALVAKVCAEFVEKRDPEKDAAWIAELDGEPAGCVLCVKKSARVAQLRLLLVEPRARGLGIGSRLVEECIRFARRSGYERMTLWTNDVLKAARRIYERAGFCLIEQNKHKSFGKDLVGQTWGLELSQ